MVELSKEDAAVIEVTGVGREDFIKAREAEKRAPDAGVAPVLVDVLSLQQVAAATAAAAAKMNVPCPNCDHTAAHPCSAATCKCSGMIPVPA